MHNEKDGMPITALREIKILKALSHKNIVKVLDIVVTPRRSSVVPFFCLADLTCGQGNPIWLARYKWSSHTWTMTLLDS
jgi:serine/threonine protein kinase